MKFFKKIIESVTPDLNVMEFPLCSVCCCLAHPNELAWQITQHNEQGLVSWSCTCTSMYVCVCTPLLFRRKAVASKLTFLDCRKTNKCAMVFSCRIKEPSNLGLTGICESNNCQFCMFEKANQDVWFITTSSLTVLLWNPLVGWSFWNNRNWQFFDPELFSKEPELAVLKCLKNWNWWLLAKSNTHSTLQCLYSNSLVHIFPQRTGTGGSLILKCLKNWNQ